MMSDEQGPEVTEAPGATSAGEETQQGATPEPDPEQALGEPGLKALREARAELRALKAELKEARERDAAREREALTEHERAIADARREAASDERDKWRRRVAETEARAALAGRVRIDPGKAMRLLDLDDIYDADDDVDVEKVRSAVDALLEAEPQLAADQPPPVPPRPKDVGIGAAGDTKPTFDRMSLDEIAAIGMPKVI